MCSTTTARGSGSFPILEEDGNDDLPTQDEWTTPCADQKNEIPVVPEGALLWDAFQNEVTFNVVSDSREADLAVASAGTDLSTLGNCFSDNEFTDIGAARAREPRPVRR